MSADPLREQEGNSRWWRLLAIVLVPTIALVGILSQAQTDIPSTPSSPLIAMPQPVPVPLAPQPVMANPVPAAPAPLGEPGAVDEARLGAPCQAADDTLAEQLDLPAGLGQGVSRVVPGGAAARAGLLAGDVLLEMNGQVVPRQRDRFLTLLSTVPANRPVDVVVLRKRVKKTLKGLTMPVPQVMAAPGAGPGLPFAIMARLGMPAPGVEGRSFHASSERNGVTIDVRGSVRDGKAVVKSISIQDGVEQRRYEHLEDVPAEFREQVRGVIERATRGRDGP
jgi:hypothetical protein